MFLKKIRLQNLLSFTDAELELQPLNVLIGPNASGKSNLVDAISLLQAAPGNFAPKIDGSGGPAAWINKSNPENAATIECSGNKPTFAYSISFKARKRDLQIVREQLRGPNSNGAAKAKAYFEREGNTLSLGKDTSQIASNHPALSQIRHPKEQEVSLIGTMIERIRVYKEFQTGPRSSTRNGISASASGNVLDADGGNLARVLDRMQLQGTLDDLRPQLSKFCELFVAVAQTVDNGISQTFITERDGPILSQRLSDGTLKFLCLLAVLFDDEPAPLVCIEEPELGLHPDAVRQVGKLLAEASHKMQLVITTHSEILIDELSENPESIVVCERGADHGTKLTRLKKQNLHLWLDRYSLGELWRKGQIGGNRW